MMGDKITAEYEVSLSKEIVIHSNDTNDGVLTVRDDQRGVTIGVSVRGHPDQYTQTTITTQQAWDLMIELQRLLAKK